MADFELIPQGFDELSADLRGVSVSAAQKALLAVQKTAKSIEAGAKQRAPVDTGNLRNSITTTLSGGAGAGASEATVTAGANYSPYVEFGTSRMAPQPFFGPAVDEATPQFEQAMAELLKGLF